MARIFTMQLNLPETSQEHSVRIEAYSDICDYSKTSITPSIATKKSDNTETQGRSSFYMDLMGDLLSSPPEKFCVEQDNLFQKPLRCSRHTASRTNKAKESSPAPSSTYTGSKLSVDAPGCKSFYAELMDGQQANLSNVNRESDISNPLQVVKEVEQSFQLSNPSSDYHRKETEHKENGTVALLPKTSAPSTTWEYFQSMNCDFKQQTSPFSRQLVLQMNSPSIPLTAIGQNNLSDEKSKTDDEQNLEASIRSSHTSVQSAERDDVYLSRTLSVIMEEAEDQGHNELDSSQQPWSHLLSESDVSSKVFPDTHAKQSSPLRLDGDSSEDHALELPSDMTKTSSEMSKLKDAPSKIMVMPLLHGRPKMTLTQTLQVAVLMVIGAIFVVVILAWVFSPVIFGV